MQRNTLLLVAILAIIAALVIGIQIGRKTATAELTPTPTASPAPLKPDQQPAAMQTYLNANCGISLRYPGTLQEVESTTSGTILADQQTPASSVLIICQEDIPRVPLPPDKIETIKLTSVTGDASVSAKLYHDASAKDGTPIDKLIFTNPKTKLDVFIGGFGETFNQVIKTVKLL
jgi:hypothetical protein